MSRAAAVAAHLGEYHDPRRRRRDQIVGDFVAEPAPASDNAEKRAATSSTHFRRLRNTFEPATTPSMLG
jgi:hypothetical protein